MGLPSGESTPTGPLTRYLLNSPGARVARRLGRSFFSFSSVLAGLERGDLTAYSRAGPNRIGRAGWGGMTSIEHWGSGVARCFVLALALGLAAACNSTDPDIPDTPVDVLYNNAIDTLQIGKTRQAAKLFDEVERQHPYSTWATQAQLIDRKSVV